MAYEENASNPPLTRQIINGLFSTFAHTFSHCRPVHVRDHFAEWYGAPPSDPHFSPLLYATHAGLAPAYIHAMGLDSLRDDAIIYERALREASVKTRIKV